MENQQPKQSLTGTQKTGLVLLLVFGLLALGLGVLQLRNIIYNPFAIRLTAEEISIDKLMDEQTRLQNIDTDHDGLNDWEELNFYETSPYLPDTDSDGMSDRDEVGKGRNPACVEGQDCALFDPGFDLASSTVTDISLSADINMEDILSVISAQLGGASTSSLDNLQVADIASLLQDPQNIRQLLLTNKMMTKEDLDKIDDETLMSMASVLIAGMVSSTPSP